MEKITLLDTSVCSENIGDFIIMNAVEEELYNIFPMSMFFHSLTHDRIGDLTYNLAAHSDYTFACGTNLISSNMKKGRLWNIIPKDIPHLNDIILMGVGWRGYQQNPNKYTQKVLDKILNKNYYHSVRDSYTKDKLQSIGITNVINTGCPTMWNLTPEHCREIPTTKSGSVVFTLTDYLVDYTNDQILIDLLKSNYENVYFWPQGIGDLSYLQKFTNTDNIEILGGNERAFNSLLDDKSIDLDYVGTRLHAGIRALQKKRKSVVIGIDNRAEEKSKDFNLVVVSRKNIISLEEVIKSEFSTEISIPIEDIQQWKNQFIK